MKTTAVISQRRNDLDWMRVLVILVVFIFHAGRFFDTGGWHVKNPITYEGVQIWTAFLASWMMPLIFIISGASIFFALNKSSVGKYIKDKILRLLVPFVVGICTHISIQVYLDRVTHKLFYGSYFEFLPHYFQGLDGFGGNFSWVGNHLWYLQTLFVYSLVLLPLFWWLKGAGAGFLKQVGDFLAKLGMVYLLALPILLVVVTINPNTFMGNRDTGGWCRMSYLLYFVYGFIIFSNERLQTAIQKIRWISLASGVVLFLVIGFLWGGSDPAFKTPRYALIFGGLCLVSWTWVLALLGFGTKYLITSTPFVKYANEAVLPFYIMHQTVLLGVGYFVVRWPIPDLVKFVIIAASSFTVILVIYEFLIRRVNALRFLFGMKTLSKKPIA